jgi:CHASE2 domain-containing sensor protein/signal transduction histidine kinase
MKHLVAVLAACFGVALAILLLSWTTYFSELNDRAYDWTLRIAGELRPESPVTIVAIDEESLNQVGKWPWNRERLAELFNKVQAAGPKAVGIDILLNDASPDPASDDALAGAIAGMPRIVLGTEIADRIGTWAKPNLKFVQNHVLLGHVHADPDLDGVNRGIYSAKQDAIHETFPAFSLQVLKAAGFHPHGDFIQQVGGAEVLHPEYVNIRFDGGRRAFPYVSAAALLNGTAKTVELKDRIVLIGFTAAGLQDERFTPFSTQVGQETSGVEIHANAIDTFYAGRPIREVSWAFLLAALFVLNFVIWMLNRNRQLEGFRFYVLAFATIPLTVILSVVLMKYANLFLPFPPFWAAVVLVVPGFEVLEIVRVNRDLDEKIGRLSLWDPGRNGWLSPLEGGEVEMESRMERRKNLLATRQRNARWRLQALDFFNEDLVRFLSFNNAILGSIEDVIIVADAGGRVVYQNPAAARLSGYSKTPPAAAEYLANVLNKRDFGTPLNDVLTNGVASSTTFIPGGDGKHYYNATFAPIGKSGIVISLHDATAEHELSQAKNDMVSLVSHELRTPLTSIRGYSDMLVKYDLVAEKGKNFLATIIQESRRLNDLIQSFLDIAYIESGRQKITMTEFELAPMLSDLTSILGPLATAKDIRLEIPNSTGLQVSGRVRADRLLLHQALSNLIINAIKYSPSGTFVCLSMSNGDGRVRFHVADQGCGIPAEESSKIFEKFYRRGNKETREQAGFGLGLAFVKEVAVKHGGDVSVESELGKGSIFTFWVPN